MSATGQDNCRLIIWQYIDENWFSDEFNETLLTLGNMSKKKESLRYCTVNALGSIWDQTLNLKLIVESQLFLGALDFTLQLLTDSKSQYNAFVLLPIWRTDSVIWEYDREDWFFEKLNSILNFLIQTAGNISLYVLEKMWFIEPKIWKYVEENWFLERFKSTLNVLIGREDNDDLERFNFMIKTIGDAVIEYGEEIHIKTLLDCLNNKEVFNEAVIELLEKIYSKDSKIWKSAKEEWIFKQFELLLNLASNKSCKVLKDDFYKIFSNMLKHSGGVHEDLVSALVMNAAKNPNNGIRNNVIELLLEECSKDSYILAQKRTDGLSKIFQSALKVFIKNKNSYIYHRKSRLNLHSIINNILKQGSIIHIQNLLLVLYEEHDIQLFKKVWSKDSDIWGHSREDGFLDLLSFSLYENDFSYLKIIINGVTRCGKISNLESCMSMLFDEIKKKSTGWRDGEQIDLLVKVWDQNSVIWQTQGGENFLEQLDYTLNTFIKNASWRNLFVSSEQADLDLKAIIRNMIKYGEARTIEYFILMLIRKRNCGCSSIKKIDHLLKETIQNIVDQGKTDQIHGLILALIKTDDEFLSRSIFVKKILEDRNEQNISKVILMLIDCVNANRTNSEGEAARSVLWGIIDKLVCDGSDKQLQTLISTLTGIKSSGKKEIAILTLGRVWDVAFDMSLFRKLTPTLKILIDISDNEQEVSVIRKDAINVLGGIWANEKPIKDEFRTNKMVEYNWSLEDIELFLSSLTHAVIGKDEDVSYAAIYVLDTILSRDSKIWNINQPIWFLKQLDSVLTGLNKILSNKEGSGKKNLSSLRILGKLWGKDGKIWECSEAAWFSEKFENMLNACIKVAGATEKPAIYKMAKSSLERIAEGVLGNGKAEHILNFISVLKVFEQDNKNHVSIKLNTLIKIVNSKSMLWSLVKQKEDFRAQLEDVLKSFEPKNVTIRSKRKVLVFAQQRVNKLKKVEGGKKSNGWSSFWHKRSEDTKDKGESDTVSSSHVLTQSEE